MGTHRARTRLPAGLNGAIVEGLVYSRYGDRTYTRPGGRSASSHMSAHVVPGATFRPVPKSFITSVHHEFDKCVRCRQAGPRNGLVLLLIKKIIFASGGTARV